MSEKKHECRCGKQCYCKKGKCSCECKREKQYLGDGSFENFVNSYAGRMSDTGMNFNGNNFSYTEKA